MENKIELPEGGLKINLRKIEDIASNKDYLDQDVSNIGIVLDLMKEIDLEIESLKEQGVGSDGMELKDYINRFNGAVKEILVSRMELIGKESTSFFESQIISDGSFLVDKINQMLTLISNFFNFNNLSISASEDMGAELFVLKKRVNKIIHEKTGFTEL